MQARSNSVGRNRVTTTKATLIRTAWATGLAAVSLLVADSTFSVAHAAQQLTCNGQMDNGWGFAAEFLDGRFTQIRWQQTGQPPQVSRLTYSSDNAQGQPIYKGSLFAAVTVTLVDLSGGDVRSGSEISVGVEEWGWARGICAGGDTGSGNGSSNWFTQLRQDLMGVSASRSREWMRENEFYFIQTMEHTNTRVVERWNRDSDNAVVDVVITNNVVVDVLRGS